MSGKSFYSLWFPLMLSHAALSEKNPSPSLTSSCRHICARQVLSLLPSLSLSLSKFISIHFARSASAEPALTGSLLIFSVQEALLKCMKPSSRLRNSAVPLFAEVTRDWSWTWGGSGTTLLGLGGHPSLVGAGGEQFIISCVDSQVRFFHFLGWFCYKNYNNNGEPVCMCK